MTNQKAINIMERCCMNGTSPVVQDAHRMAIEALKKQAPMKSQHINKLNNGMKYSWCPACEYAQNYENAKYCYNCGQRLDWEGSDENQTGD